MPDVAGDARPKTLNSRRMLLDENLNSSSQAVMLLLQIADAALMRAEEQVAAKVEIADATAVDVAVATHAEVFRFFRKSFIGAVVLRLKKLMWMRHYSKLFYTAHGF